MSNITITETCCCGARFEGSGYTAYVERQADKFREAHTVCRERTPDPAISWLLPTRPFGEEE